MNVYILAIAFNFANTCVQSEQFRAGFDLLNLVV